MPNHEVMRPGLPALPVPGPVPRIERASQTVTDLLGLFWVRRCGVGGLSPRDPRTSLAATLTPIAHPAYLAPLVRGGLVAGRRSPPCPRLLASHGYL